jgi:hypothetical protein
MRNGLRILAVVAACLAPLPVGGQTPKTARALAQRIVEAHGGIEKWRATKTVSYEHTLLIPTRMPDNDNWWISRETVEHSTKRVYQEWPLEKAKLVYDGKQVWTVDWGKDNPPAFMVHAAYYVLDAPWLTQDPGVRLEGPGKDKLPGDPKEYLTLKVWYSRYGERTPRNYYVLYVDPVTYRVKGYAYNVTYGTLLDLMKLPPEVSEIGPTFHVFTAYETHGGLTFPVRYETYDREGKIYGYHIVRDLKVGEAFDERRLKRPANAVVDRSSPFRKAAAK